MALEHADFSIGREFWTETGRWRCTDVGARTICAIKLDGDARNWNGPYPCVAQHVSPADAVPAPLTFTLNVPGYAGRCDGTETVSC